MSDGAGAPGSMSHEERLALAARLDRELDEFIDGLEKKRYTEGWPEDRWQEEMEKHPFFMKTVPDGELSPLAEGLAKLKYDEDENTPSELATNYKEDGNFNFKHKNYRLAILGYTEGIKVKCGDPEIESSLYNNRSAAHYELKNYRSALADAEKALSLKPDHLKARFRIAKCALNTSQYDKCIENCEKYLSVSNDEKVVNLMKEAKKLKQFNERDRRRKDRSEEKLEMVHKLITDEVTKRGIKVYKQKGDEIDYRLLEPNLPGALDSVVHINDGILYWPVLVLYPELGMTDFIKDCPENVPLGDQLSQLFPAPWDDDNKYSIGSINVYFEGDDKKNYRVNLDDNLGDVMVMEHFVLKAGTPAFIVVVRNSSVEKRFLQG